MTDTPVPDFESGHEKGPSPSMADALHAAAADHNTIGDGHKALAGHLDDAANAIDGAETPADLLDGGESEESGGETDSGGSAARSAVSAPTRGLVAVRSNPGSAKTFNAMTGRR